MKTSLSYLPQIKQDQILHIVDIIKAIVDPEMIILYGSYAKGNYKEHRYRASDGTEYEFRSDYDFLIVTKNNPSNVNDIDDKINAQIPDDYPDLGIEIHEIDYINEGLEFGQYFFSDIVNEGILLYTTDQLKFAVPKELTNDDKKQIAQRYFDIWFEKGVALLHTVKFNLDHRELKLAAFLLHQTAESFYYTTLLVFTGYKPKTHNLKRLRKQVKTLSEELFLLFGVENNKTEKHLFDLLKRGYIDARYRQDYFITEDEALKLYERLERMKVIVESISRLQIQSHK